MPLFEPTLYALTELRATSKASATIEQALRGVMVLHLVLDQLGVDLDLRLRNGRLLELSEVEEVARQCRLPLSSIVGEEGSAPAQAMGVVRLEQVRMRVGRRGQADSVDPDTAGVRLHYIHDYLKWRGTAQLLKFGPQHRLYAGLAGSLEVVLHALEERTPRSRGRNREQAREGLSDEARARLLDVIRLTAPDNPWKNEHARVRNQLMVRWLYDLGVRRGELLGVRISDINFQANEVLIARRADDPLDPRRRQPNAKTSDRLLALEEDLAVLTRQYITAQRRAIRGARRHDFLFVANGSGAPLTMAALNKVFVTLRERVPDLPDELSPHVLRHTWNDRFSDLMDAKQVSEETEKKLRSTLMGWSPTSQTAAIYTRRHTRRRAQEASLDLQRQMKKREQK